jgi:hypothetical protein
MDFAQPRIPGTHAADAELRLPFIKRPRSAVAQNWLKIGSKLFEPGDVRAVKRNIESGEGGPCLTDAAHEAALDEPLVLATPLRCGPNGYRSDYRGTKPRWRHAILRAMFGHAVSRRDRLH